MGAGFSRVLGPLTKLGANFLFVSTFGCETLLVQTSPVSPDGWEFGALTRLEARECAFSPNKGFIPITNPPILLRSSVPNPRYRGRVHTRHLRPQCRFRSDSP